MSIAVSVLYRLKESSVFFGKRNNDKDENLEKTGIRFVFACYLKRKDNRREGTSIKTRATYDLRRRRTFKEYFCRFSKLFLLFCSCC